MSCCPGPKHGREFDPDHEAPSEADMARFSGGCEDDEGWHDDEAYEREGVVDAGKDAQKKILAFVAVVLIVVFVWAYVL